MPFSLPSMLRARGVRRNITFRPIVPTKAQASDLASIIMAVVRVWQEATPRIMASYDPVPFGDALTTDDIPGTTRAINEADGIVSQIMVLISSRLRAWAVREERWHRSKWIAATKAATDIDLSAMLTALPAEETLESWLAWNVALVQDVSDQAKQKISNAVYAGYQTRKPSNEVAKEIAEATGFARDRARRIAQDQTTKLAGQLDAERQAEAGIEMFRYRHGGKVHARPWHLARNGKIYELKTGKQVGGDDVIARGDGPTEPPFCSCIRQAYIPLLDEFGL